MKYFSKLISRLQLLRENVSRFDVVVIVLIFLLSLGLRAYKVTETFMWEGDAARDVYVARHLSLYKTDFLPVPYASGNYGLVSNSPFYYQMLSVFYSLGRSPHGVLFFFVTISSIVPILSYELGLLLSGREFGIGLAMATIFGKMFLEISRQIWQPNLLPAFVLISLLFFTIGIKNKNLVYVIIANQIFFLSAHLHLSALPHAVLMSLLSFFLFKKDHKKIRILFLITAINCLLFFWVLFLNKDISVLYQSLIFGDGDVGEILSLNQGVNSYLLKPLQMAIDIQKEAFKFEKISHYYLGIGAILLAWAALLVKSFDFKLLKIKHAVYFYFLVLNIAPFFILLFYPGKIEPQYSVVFAIFEVLSLMVAINLLQTRLVRLGLFSLLVIIMSHSSKYLFATDALAVSNYEMQQQVVERIISDLESNTLQNPEEKLFSTEFFVEDEGSCFDVFTHAYWYSIEDKFSNKFTALRKDGQNRHYNKNAKFGYLICDVIDGSDFACLEKFVPPHKIEAQEKIAEVIVGLKSKTVYSLQFDLNSEVQCEAATY